MSHWLDKFLILLKNSEKYEYEVINIQITCEIINKSLLLLKLYRLVGFECVGGKRIVVVRWVSSVSPIVFIRNTKFIPGVPRVGPLTQRQQNKAHLGHWPPSRSSLEPLHPCRSFFSAVLLILSALYIAVAPSKRSLHFSETDLIRFLHFLKVNHLSNLILRLKYSTYAASYTDTTFSFLSWDNIFSIIFTVCNIRII